MKGKVVDSFKAGLPCVMSPAAAEGLDLPKRLTAPVADSSEAFTERILRLHADDAARPRHGAGGAGLCAGGVLR